METIKRCRVCESDKIKPFFDLGKQPLANSLLASPNEPENLYPLSLSWCENCELVQLNETIDPKIMFTTYPWVTGTSKTAKDFAVKFSEEALRRSSSDRPFVLEIASNDGTFLAPFIKKGYKALGVDPAENIVKDAVKDGIPTLAEFFNADVAEKVLAKNGPADIVIARNVLYHLANLRDVMKGIERVLANGGVFIAEFHYAGKMLKELHYDTIYHEHVCYYTLKTFEKLLGEVGLHAFDIGVSPINSGGLIVYARKAKGEVSTAMERLREEEKADGANQFENWKKFGERAIEHKKKLLFLLKNAAQHEGRPIGWGASARSSTMLNFCGITADMLPVVIDLNPLKQGKYTAGTHIPIKNADDVMKENPRTVFLLAWNFRDEIESMLRKKYSFAGECIVPLPGDPRIETI
ncbi:MAG TPA: class I SAM-dependent methyltransferase [Candidatus Paceibacterota bacterium]|nr:class I SAM-dependent methyltransferase [Candidatus Paceibacterota bacterium]